MTVPEPNDYKHQSNGSSDSTQNGATVAFKTVLTIITRVFNFSVVLFAGVLVLPTTLEAALPSQQWFGCTCYFDSDCGGWDYCGAGFLCGDRGKNDGTCDILHWPGQPGIQHEARAFMARSLDLRLQAYETALENGGGLPDSVLMTKANKFPLSPKTHEDLKKVAAFIQVMLHGTHRKGWAFVDIKPLDECCSYPSDPDDFGRLEFGKNQKITPLGVAEIVRSAIVEEIRDPNRGIYEDKMGLIRSDFPNFKPVHRCEFPHPKEHGHLFPFYDGVDCLIDQLESVLHSLDTDEKIWRRIGNDPTREPPRSP